MERADGVSPSTSIARPAGESKTVKMRGPKPTCHARKQSPAVLGEPPSGPPPQQRRFGASTTPPPPPVPSKLKWPGSSSSLLRPFCVSAVYRMHEWCSASRPRNRVPSRKHATTQFSSACVLALAPRLTAFSRARLLKLWPRGLHTLLRPEALPPDRAVRRQLTVLVEVVLFPGAQRFHELVRVGARRLDGASECLAFGGGVASAARE